MFTALSPSSFSTDQIRWRVLLLIFDLFVKKCSLSAGDILICSRFGGGKRCCQNRKWRLAPSERVDSRREWDKHDLPHDLQYGCKCWSLPSGDRIEMAAGKDIGASTAQFLYPSLRKLWTSRWNGTVSLSLFPLTSFHWLNDWDTQFQLQTKKLMSMKKNITIDKRSRMTWETEVTVTVMMERVSRMERAIEDQEDEGLEGRFYWMKGLWCLFLLSDARKAADDGHDDSRSPSLKSLMIRIALNLLMIHTGS